MLLPASILHAFAVPAVVMHAAVPTVVDSFDRLKAFVGRWQGTASDGRAIDIRYRLIANGNALVEEWVSPSGARTMTVYYRDGRDVLATHFCAQGNQPRLRLDRDTPGRLSFTFRDGTNLTPGASHQHDFWIDSDGGTTMRRAETYRAGKDSETTTISLTRTVTQLD